MVEGTVKKGYTIKYDGKTYKEYEKITIPDNYGWEFMIDSKKIEKQTRKDDSNE